MLVVYCRVLYYGKIYAESVYKLKQQMQSIKKQESQTKIWRERDRIEKYMLKSLVT